MLPGGQAAEVLGGARPFDTAQEAVRAAREGAEVYVRLARRRSSTTERNAAWVEQEAADVRSLVESIGVRRAGFGIPGALTACQTSQQRRSGLYILAGARRLSQAVRGRRAGGTGGD